MSLPGCGRVFRSLAPRPLFRELLRLCGMVTTSPPQWQEKDYTITRHFYGETEVARPHLSEGRPAMRCVTVCFFVMLGAFGLPAAAQSPGEPAANPGRPTVSTPATLTPPGYLQFESGFVAAGDSPEFSSRYSFTEAIKFSLASRLELLAVAEPITHSTAGGAGANHVADIFLGAQGVVYRGEGAKPTLAISYFHRVYDGGAPEFDLGSPLNSFLVLASADVKGFHYDANAFFTELKQMPVHRAQYGQSLTVSHPIRRRFTLSGEIWRFTQPFLRSNTVGNLWALSYMARKNLVFDAAFNRGLTATSTRWQVLAGFTYLLPHRL
jgi:hypothetical protein